MLRQTVVWSLAFASALLISATAHAETRTVTLSVPGMTCELCPITVSKALKRIGGVEKVTANLGRKEAVVTFDDARTSAEALREATAKAGYPSTLAP
jgi:mercuric ion binding protein